MIIASEARWLRFIRYLILSIAGITIILFITPGTAVSDRVGHYGSIMWGLLFALGGITGCAGILWRNKIIERASLIPLIAASAVYVGALLVVFINRKLPSAILFIVVVFIAGIVGDIVRFIEIQRTLRVVREFDRSHHDENGEAGE